MSSPGYMGYTAGQCTWYVARTLDWIGQWGDAYQWLGRAQSQGLQTSATPVVGAVAVWGQNMGGARDAGHVGIVTGIDNAGAPIVSEMNWSAGPGRSDTRDTHSTAGIIGYILPPGSSGNTGAMEQVGAIPAGMSAAASIAGQHTSEISGSDCVSLRDMVTNESSLVPGAATVAAVVKWATQPCVYKRTGLVIVAAGLVLIGLRLAGQSEPLRIVMAPAHKAAHATRDAAAGLAA